MKQESELERLEREFSETIEAGEFVKGDTVLLLLKEVQKARMEIFNLRNELIALKSSLVNGQEDDKKDASATIDIDYDTLSMNVADRVTKMLVGALIVAGAEEESCSNTSQSGEHRSERESVSELDAVALVGDIGIKEATTEAKDG